MVLCYELYIKIFQPNVSLNEKTEQYIYIPTGSNFINVLEILSNSGLLINTNSFEWVAKQKKYTQNIKPGRYYINRKLNNNELVNLLRSGVQIPVKIMFRNMKTKEDIVGNVAQQLEIDSLSIISFITNTAFLSKKQLTEDNVSSIFIPNTYEFYWNISTEYFVERILKEYDVFWKKEREQKAKEIGLNKVDVSILASIVEKESYMKDERPTIARLYMNRLEKKMPLQSDPTIIFAIGDFNIKRVLKKDLKFESLYNTYLHKGLPPGPICVPSINAIDAVLNAPKNGFLFMCAKEDFSGYHNFAKTSREHNKNANKYRRALNKRKIMR